MRHIIDCDADPLNPKAKYGWTIDKHQKGGILDLNPTKMVIHRAVEDGYIVRAEQFLKELAGRPVFNANVLDYLHAHPDVIPKEWERDEKGIGRRIFFPGTIYRGPKGGLWVRYLSFWGGDGWLHDYDGAIGVFDCHDFAALQGSD